MKKYIYISVISLLAIVVLYNSVYFEKLDAKKVKEGLKDFNPKDSAEYFWNSQLEKVLLSAIDLKLFDSQLADNPEFLIRQYGKAVGITSTFCFLVKGTAKPAKPGSEEIPVDITNGYADYSLQAKYIFGNTARDATGYFNIDDFENTMDFNAVATELNKLILEKEVAKLDSLSTGKKIAFVGALEINSENIPRQISIIPLSIEVLR
ncbi:DUF2291 family protein [candidate division KSB1 bacterium]|nr:DUF2291 family protein [candidate division KSB1 bacterium]